MSLPKIKEVRAYFMGGATAEKGRGERIITTKADTIG